MRRNMKGAKLALAAATIGAWGVLFLNHVAAVSTLADAGLLILGAGLAASIWVSLFSRRKLSPQASTMLASLLLVLGLSFLVVQMAARGG